MMIVAITHTTSRHTTSSTISTITVIVVLLIITSVTDGNTVLVSVAMILVGPIVIEVTLAVVVCTAVDTPAVDRSVAT